jgi:hypothetical protein
VEDDNNSLDILGIKPVADAINTVTESSVKGAGNFLSLICLPAAEEFGLLLKDKVSHWRAKNAVDIVNKTQKLIENNKQNSTSLDSNLHPRVICSVIENASWSDNDFMQNFWAGLLASSCLSNREDESNLIFISLLKELTTNQAKLIEHICQKIEVIHRHGFIASRRPLFMTVKELQDVSGLQEFYRLDLELDRLRSLELISTGFNLEASINKADVTPTAICLQLYVRCQGYIGSPIDYFGITEGAL